MNWQVDRDAVRPMVDHRGQTSALTALLDAFGGLQSVYQPIVDLTTGRALAYEALSRFGDGASSPSVFEHARKVGVGHELEVHAILSALGAGDPPDGLRLSVNLSPSALTSETVLAALPQDLSRITVEVTENELVANEDAIKEGLDELRKRGALIAVDDAGAGYASLRQVMELRPDVIKLDRSLIMGVHTDPAKRALIRAFVTFGRHLGGRVCAEGIELAEELRALADLDVNNGQGYLFARPGKPWSEVCPRAASLCRAALSEALRGGASAPERDAETSLETVGRALASCRGFEELDRCLQITQRLLDVPEISLSRIVPHEGARGVVACAGPRWSREPVYRLADYPATAWALETDEALQVLVSDAAADPAERELLVANGYGALLLIPLRLRGVAVGMIEIFSSEEQPWTRRHITLARAVAHQLAMLLPQLAPA